MKKSFTLLLLAVSAFHFSSKAQDLPCGTAYLDNLAMESNPNIVIEKEQFEDFVRDFAQQQHEKAGDEIITIPVVWHVIYNGSTGAVSDNNINSAMNLLNNDFQKLSSDQTQVASAFKPIHADTKIEFRLAKKDPDGNPTTGILRIQSAETSAGNDDTKKLSYWPRGSYLNIWVVYQIDIGQSSVAGYTYVPASVNSNAIKDGIMIRTYTVGGRTLTHEAGHWLSCYHTWGPTNSPGEATNCDVDDGVDDTPNTEGVTSCNKSHQSCGSLDNVENFMSYSSCTKMFTEGQKTRMRAALNNNTAQRNNLWHPANLIATGLNCPTSAPCAPVADFRVNKNLICEGASIDFEDFTSKGEPTSWEWTFPGGSPASSTAQHPSVVYNAAGSYGATLKATNSVSNSSATKNFVVEVISTTAKYANPTYSENFENVTSIPDNDFNINNVGGGNDWEIANGISAGTGSKAVKVNNLNNTMGSVTELITPSIDISATGTSNLYFRMAYAQKTTASDDRLEVFYSTNCGENWIKRKSLSGSGLATTAATTSTFTPAAGDWKDHVVLISPIKSFKNVLFKFVFTSGENEVGNNIYLDDINTLDPNGIIDLEDILLDFNMYPNPTQDQSTIAFSLEEQKEVAISIYNVLGAKITNLTNGILNQGDHLFKTTNLPAGLYTVQIVLDGEAFNKKLMIQ